jgi:hypothetical protein
MEIKIEAPRKKLQGIRSLFSSMRLNGIHFEQTKQASMEIIGSFVRR